MSVVYAINQTKKADLCRWFSRVSPYQAKPARERRCVISDYTAQRGMTLLELILLVAIIGVLASIAVVAYTGYIDTAKITNAEKQIRMISLTIDEYYSEYKAYPASLADVNLDTLKDPWGNPYHYLNIASATGLGEVRKDHNLVPLNTDYDLYSSGKDGASLPPLTAKTSKDDIIRANNGGFVGLASNY